MIIKIPTPKNYLVKFFRKPDEKKKDRAYAQDEYMGCVTIDDTGVNQHQTLMGKAFRQAPAKFLGADKVKVERV